MVNRLLTISIKVNVPETAESKFDRGFEMKKQTRGFWSWILGHGWGNTGSGG
jgi:hypothetical protein